MPQNLNANLNQILQTYQFLRQQILPQLIPMNEGKWDNEIQNDTMYNYNTSILNIISHYTTSQPRKSILIPSSPSNKLITNENDSSDEVAQIQYFDVSNDNTISNHVTNNLRVPVVEHDINNLIPLLIRSLNKVRYTIQNIKSFN